MIQIITRNDKSKGQSLAEMALALPIILLLVFGLFELGRIVIIFGSVNNASREAARFGAAIGVTIDGIPRYLACDAIREHAIDASPFANLASDDIEIAYDTSSGGSFVRYAQCDDGEITADEVKLGDRIVITVTGQINSIVPFIPDFSPTFVTARTILKNIAIGPTECNDGVDNDGDGFIDHPLDDGCTTIDDTIEATCYRLSLIASPPDGGTMSINPEPNCSNRYIESTIVNLEAFKDIRTEIYTDTLYTFSHWTGITTTSVYSNPTTVVQDADKDVVAHFRLLTSDLAVQKSYTPAVATSGDSFTYTININNPYTDTARYIVMTDTLPIGVDYAGVWSSIVVTGTTACTGHATSVITCTLSELGVGQVATFDFAVTAPVVNDASVSLTNTVTISAFEVDPDLGNNTATVVTDIAPRAELAISKIGPASYTISGTIGYSLEVTNSGPSDATGVRVTDNLPAGLTLPPLTDARCVYNSGAHTLDCDIGVLLAAGPPWSYSYSVNAPGALQPVSNTATVTSNEFEHIYLDNTAGLVINP